MCGIIGYVGRQEAAPILLEGLERMEYRGYDSTGMAVCGDGVLRVCKKKGRVQVLREMSHDGADLPGTLGIGHTRWATHGEPSDVNAHPHLSQSGKFAVVHNGIIENFIALKEELLQKGYTFRSETDTEVVAQLLDYYYSDCGDFFEAMNRLLHAVDGAYALGIICADYPDRLVAARKDAPLLLGFGDGENFIASDVTALIRHTRDIAYMDDGELAILSRSGIRVYDRQLRPVEKKHHHVDWEVDAAEKGGYAHFMLKEIMEQPAAIRKATAARIQGGRVVLQDLTMTPEQIRAIGRIYIVACGSSYHVGMVGKYNLERMLRRSVEVCLASEFRYCDPIVGERDLVIVISQSGETLDTMAALREAKKRGARILSIVNVVGSSIARESDDVLYTWAGPEIAVATTKAYSTQMAVLNLLGLYFGEVMGTVDYETYTAMIRDILDLPEKLEQAPGDEGHRQLPGQPGDDLIDGSRQHLNQVRHAHARLLPQVADSLGVDGKHPQHRQHSQLPAPADQVRPGGDDAVGPAAAQVVHGDLLGGQPCDQVCVDHRLLPGPVDPIHQLPDVQNIAAQQEHRRPVMTQGTIQGLRLLHRRDHRRPLQKRQHGMGHRAHPPFTNPSNSRCNLDWDRSTPGIYQCNWPAHR